MKNFSTRMVKETIEVIDFIDVYKEVFGGDPYNEVWTTPEVKKEYDIITAENGAVISCYINNKCIGFVTYREEIAGEHPVKYPDTEKVGYISDIAVLKEYRNKGIGTFLFSACLINMRIDGYTIALMRTLQKGKSMSYDIAIRAGMKVLENVTELVQKDRNDDNREETDKRIFLDMML